MASVDKRRTASGEVRYYARWRDPDGQSRAKSFKRKTDADRHLVGVQHRMLSGDYVDPASGRITLREYAEAYWAPRRVTAPGTIKRQDEILRLYIFPALGGYELRRIRRGDVEAAVAGWAQTLAAGSVRNVRALLSQVMRAAVIDRFIQSSPAEGVRGPRVHRELLVPLTPQQIADWIAATSERHRVALALMAGCGLRIGEACGLTVDRLDMLRGSARIDRQLLGTRIADVHFGPPKTPSSVRTVPMPAVVREIVAAHLARFGTGHLDTVLSTGNGSSLTTGTLRTVLYHSAKRAALPDGTSPHDGRHHFASVLIDAGCSVKSVQSKMGHKTARETLDTYSHLFADDDTRAASAIDSALGPLVSPATVYAACTGTDG